MAKNKAISLYPSKRQKALFRGDPRFSKYQLITSGAIMSFRKLFSLMFFICLAMLIAGCFEIVSYVMTGSDAIKMRILSPSKTVLAMVFIGSVAMMINQILLILGHGYSHKAAQLYVDSVTPKKDCVANLRIIQSMYAISLVSALVLLWGLWGFFGTPFYKGQFHEQLLQLKDLLDYLQINYGNILAEDVAPKLKFYLWFISCGLALIVFTSIVGWLQAVIARLRIVK